MTPNQPNPMPQYSFDTEGDNDAFWDYAEMVAGRQITTAEHQLIESHILRGATLHEILEDIYPEQWEAHLSQLTGIPAEHEIKTAHPEDFPKQNPPGSMPAA